MVFNDADGLYTYTYEAEQKEDCAACSQIPQDLTFPSSAKLQHVLNHLMESSALQMKCPAITATIHGRNKTLYMQTVASIEERTRPNLTKTLTGEVFNNELGTGENVGGCGGKRSFFIVSDRLFFVLLSRDSRARPLRWSGASGG
uniref:E2 binding domain-containing protein n=1 Tax=Eptatretus burgeri TaxID=7764 RepID=A0A8C4QY10_EPTBU